MCIVRSRALLFFTSGVIHVHPPTYLNLPRQHQVSPTACEQVQLFCRRMFGDVIPYDRANTIPTMTGQHNPQALFLLGSYTFSSVSTVLRILRSVRHEFRYTGHLSKFDLYSNSPVMCAPQKPIGPIFLRWVSPLIERVSTPSGNIRTI